MSRNENHIRKNKIHIRKNKNHIRKSKNHINTQLIYLLMIYQCKNLIIETMNYHVGFFVVYSGFRVLKDFKNKIVN